MLPCGTCGNDVYEEFEHCYNEIGLGRSWGEWMRCKQCYTEIDYDTFLSMLQGPEARTNDVPIDGADHKDVSGPQKTAICLKCPNAVFEEFKPWNESMRCKKCQNVMGLNTFMSRLGVEDTASNKSHPTRGLIHPSGQGNNTPLQRVSPEKLEAMKLKLFSRPCFRCGNDGEPNFTFTFDQDDVILIRSCKQCKEVMGLDNAMTPDQINQLLTSGKIRVKSCVCGNADPEDVVLEQRGLEVALVCNVCKKDVNYIGDAAFYERREFARDEAGPSVALPGRAAGEKNRATKLPEPKIPAGAEASGSKTAWEGLASVYLTTEKFLDYLFKSGCLVWEVWGDYAKQKAGKMSKEELAKSRTSRVLKAVGGDMSDFGGQFGYGLGQLVGSALLGKFIGRSLGYVINNFLQK